MSARYSRPRIDRVLSALIQTAYLPAEIPPTVTARYFADHIRSNYKTLKSYKPSIPTHFDKFSIPRENGTRRDLAVVHPAAQLGLSTILAQNHKSIRDIIKKTGISLYDTQIDLDNFKAFKGISFRELDNKRTEIAEKKRFILNADISRFFYTIYTHSIPWAVVGKEKIKEKILQKSKMKKSFHWTERIDAALQMCQSRETFGIPVGPDTSRIIAEILLSGIHSDPDFQSHIDKSEGFRLVDDFFIGFESEIECHNTLRSLKNSLGIYNLQLNDDKTWIKSSRDIFMDRWRYELLHVHIPLDDGWQQARSVKRLAELALYHSKDVGNAFPVKWAAQKLLHTTFHRENFDLLLSIFLRFSRDFPICVNIAVAFIINNKAASSKEPAILQIKDWVRSIFRNHGQHSHDFEVSWALVVCGSLKIRVSRNDFGEYFESMCSVAFATLGLLQTHNLLEDTLSSFNWRGQVKKSGLNGPHWLMYYESVLRKWTNDKKMIDSVNSHDLFGKLVKDKISFLDDTVFGDITINLDRRRISRIRRNSPRENFGVQYGSFGLGSI